MSLVGCVKGAHGLAVVADSRRLVYHRDGGSKYVAMDDCPKLVTFADPHRWVVAGVCMEIKGPAALSFSLAGLLSEIEASLPPQRLPVRKYAIHVSRALVRRTAASTDVRLVAIVAGYDEGEAGGRMYVVDSLQPEAVEHHAGAVGMSWLGGREFIDRLLLGVDARLLDDARDCDDYNVYARVPLAMMPLQDCAEFATFMVKTTMQMQRFTVGRHGVGGTINLATITRAEGVRRDVVPGVAAAPGIQEIGDMFDVKTETTSDEGGLTHYTVK